MSAEQLGLIKDEDRVWMPAGDRTTPVVWVRELIILRNMEPSVEPVRRILLHPGLNILWAQPGPENEPAKLNEPGMSGHASGKTTFCRLLRFVLGEPNFGAELLRMQIRDKFPDGWVAAEVLINKEPWLVCRPFAGSQPPLISRNATLADLYSKQRELVQLKEYRAALDNAVVGPLQVQSFASNDKPISWLHILAWLARDQEARFSDLTEWRHKLSGFEGPFPDAEDRNHLLRAVLDLIDPEEHDELQRNARLLAQRDRARTAEPLHENQLGVDCDRLRRAIPELTADKLDDLALEAASKRVSRQIERLDAEIVAIQADRTVEQLRQRMEAANKSVGAAESHFEEAQEQLKDLQAILDTAEERMPQAALDDYFSKRKPTGPFCNVPLEYARQRGCTLANQQPLDLASASAAQVLQGRADRTRQQIEAMKPQLAVLQSRLSEREQIANRALAAFRRADDDRAAQLTKRRLERQTQESLLNLIENVTASRQQLEKTQQEIAQLDAEIKKSYDTQAAIRKRLATKRGDFSNTFRAIIKALAGDDVDATAEMSGRNIDLSVSKRGTLTSAAIETIKVLAFDLAALASSIEGRGCHPRFLIHDGPREADMQASVYHRLFLLARELEQTYQTAPPAFQYIITTTTPPPLDMQESSPWLLDPVLSGADETRRLLGVNL